MPVCENCKFCYWLGEFRDMGSTVSVCLRHKDLLYAIRAVAHGDSCDCPAPKVAVEKLILDSFG